MAENGEEGSPDYRQAGFVALAAVALFVAAAVAPPIADGDSQTVTPEGELTDTESVTERSGGDDATTDRSTGGSGSASDGSSGVDGGSGSSGKPGSDGGSAGDGSGSASNGSPGADGRPGSDGGDGDGARDDGTGSASDGGSVAVATGTDAGGEAGNESADGQRGDPDVITPGEDGAFTVDGRCSIAVDGEPVPGARLAVTVLDANDGPVVDVPVWFNDRRVGRTNSTGTVAGRVPYESDLAVRVDFGDRSACRTGPTTAFAAGVAGGLEPAIQDDTNATIELEVEGSVELTVHGRPYPGETVVLEANIEGVPMREATVEVDGETVGRTGDDGRAEIAVPADGSSTFDVRVSRGDFAGTTTVDVLLLEATLSPDGLALVPGGSATVVATMGGQPVPDATVSVDGERRGTTDSAGEFPLELPTDPTATVTVSTEDQTATTSVAAVYRAMAGVLILLGLFVAALAAIGYRVRGPAGAGAVVAGVVAVLTVVIADGLWGPRGRFAALAVVGLLVLGAAAVYWRGRVRRGASNAGGLVAWLTGSLVGAARRAAALVTRLRRWLAARAGRFAAWLGSLPRSVPGLFARAAAWLAALLDRVGGVLRRPARRTVVAAAAVAVALATAYVVTGTESALAVLLATGVNATVRWRAGRERAIGGAERASTDDAGEPTAPTATAAASDETADRPSFRQLWRAFARRVVPSGWQTRTPGEIERAAIERGYPDRPVRELTTLFREVEYGDRPLTEAVRDRADEAYRSLTDDDGGERR